MLGKSNNPGTAYYRNPLVAGKTEEIQKVDAEKTGEEGEVDVKNSEETGKEVSSNFPVWRKIGGRSSHPGFC